MANTPLNGPNSIGNSLPPSGHAYCPHCEVIFDTSSAKATLIEPAPLGDTLLYVMCQDFHDDFNHSDKSTSKAMSDLCFNNFKVKHNLEDQPVPHWAITSLFTVNFNNGNLANAIEHGHGLPHHIYNGLLTGDIQILPLASGDINIVFSHTDGNDHG
jgi:hypothetical protein